MAYPAETWAKIKADYETGNYSTEKLSEIYQISDPAIRLKAREDNWEKGRLKPKIEEQIERNMIKLFAKKGCAPEKIVEKIIDGMDANRTINIGDGQSSIEADHNARVKYIQEANKMMGNYSPEEIKHSGSVETNVYDLSVLDDDELKEFKRLMEKVRRD